MPRNRATRTADASESGALAEYLAELRAIRSTGAGVAETSYYPALSNLFNAIGVTLKPRVRCIININNQGAGIPDGGLFTADQFQRQSDFVPKAGQLPARGAIEAKGTKPDVLGIALSTQVKNYLSTYGIVVATNLRDFVIVTRDAHGNPDPMERFSLAENEQEFWRHTMSHPGAVAEVKGGPFIEFIKRACLHAAPLTKPKDVAWFLASYARDALARVERQKELPALQKVRAALEQALGMKFIAEKGEHFFRSTLVQTLFYGVFSAWVRWDRDNPDPASKFDWRTAEWSLHVPFIRALYEEVAKPSSLKPLGLVEVLDWTAGVLNRVRRGEFFKDFEDERAVQYFYEPFLEAYDPVLRKQLGVWYTPAEIVKYQVARVDRVLRDELNLPDGLADTNVVVLDPCCGTGAYLVEVLHRIAATLRDKGGDALVASDLKQAAMARVFGFEIMPAPFVVSHLQLGSMLQNQGAPLSSRKAERVGVYLTNALTGWEPPKGPKQQVMSWAELQEERDAAEHVKRDKKILVVLGNPPYNAFAGVSPHEEAGLVEPYKKGLNKPVSEGGWGIKKFNLDELYVRFFRLAERRIAEMSGQGVVSFISNYSYLSDPSFVVMRERFLAEFDKLWFDCMNGDSRETGKLTPDGKPDPSVFSTDYNREGIRVGTAVCVMLRAPAHASGAEVRFRSFWGATKKTELLQSASSNDFDAGYTAASPARPNRYSFRPQRGSAGYGDWPNVEALASAQPLLGLNENRKQSLYSFDRASLVSRMTAYFDKNVSNEELRELHAGLVTDAAGFHAVKVRRRLLTASAIRPENIVRYAVFPFDFRWAYLETNGGLWNRVRPQLVEMSRLGQRFLLMRRHAPTTRGGPCLYALRHLADQHVMHKDAYFVPTLLPISDSGHLFKSNRTHANLSEGARAYLLELGVPDPDRDVKTAALIWMHALAIGYSPAYLSENADGIRRDWPRIPLPATRAALEASASLGEQVAALLDTEAEVPGVTSRKISPVFKCIGLITKTGGGQLDAAGGDLEVTAGWGIKGKGGVTMPSKGKRVDRPYAADETRAIEAEGAARGMPAADIVRPLGDATCDVSLNSSAFWRNIPMNVWEYHIGGYQVIKKWLSYREAAILGRPIKPEEAREVTNTARRIAALILLQPRLDENYAAIKTASSAWPAARLQDSNATWPRVDS